MVSEVGQEEWQRLGGCSPCSWAAFGSLPPCLDPLDLREMVLVPLGEWKGRLEPVRCWASPGRGMEECFSGVSVSVP